MSNFTQGCPRCPRWIFGQRGRQFDSVGFCASGIWGVSTLSTLIYNLSRAWAGATHAHLTHDSCRNTPDSVDTPTQTGVRTVLRREKVSTLVKIAAWTAWTARGWLDD